MRYSSAQSYEEQGSSDDFNVAQSRLEIIPALLSLGETYRFCAYDTDVAYDVAYLGSLHGVLLICYAEVVDSSRGHRLALDQSFVLRKKDFNEEDRQAHRFVLICDT